MNMTLFREVVMGIVSMGLLSFSFMTEISASEMGDRFDHDLHTVKVFKPNKIECSHCHTFSLDAQSKKIILEPGAKDSILKLSAKQICHECHQTPETQYSTAPKECYSCHQGVESLNRIMPINHKNVSWKNSHSTVARIQGDKCFECHTESLCTKCHIQRNDLQMQNHSRNYRFYHSIDARLQPQKCTTCHAISYCTSCHLGKTYH
jgi:hypothetical protein